MSRHENGLWMFSVALLTEGVDRNTGAYPSGLRRSGSPSSRRAWIEIVYRLFCHRRCRVALLTEGVDRNRSGSRAFLSRSGRPPHGGRG